MGSDEGIKDDSTPKSVAYILGLAIIAMTVLGILEMMSYNKTQLEYAWNMDNRLYSFFVSEANIDKMFEFSVSIANFIKEDMGLKKTDGLFKEIGMMDLYYKLPVIIEFYSRRIVLCLFVILIGFPVSFYAMMNGFWARQKRMVGRCSPSPYFGDVGGLLFGCGILYILFYPLASLPVTGQFFWYIIVLSSLIALANLKGGKWEFSLPLIFILSSVLLGPWGVLVGFIIFITGVHHLCKQWTDFM